MKSQKYLFSRALTAGAGKLHLAAHSHHLWPDVTCEAHMQAWQDAATNWDAKWTKVMDQIIPEAQSHIARHLKLADPATIVFAPNTHEFVLRLFSALPTPARILTTDSEFHSFSRQAARLAEDGLITVDIVPTEPFENFPQRFANAAALGPHDMVFVSHVFFNSGYAIADLNALVAAIPNPETLVVIDGYHGFMARPTDLSAVQNRAFYLAGGYKYGMAGEGACFLVCPPGYAPRPRNTGWFAAFGALADQAAGVPYAPDGARFFGATFDPSGLYRLNAVMRMLQAENIEVAHIHARAQNLQTDFAATLDQANLPGLTISSLIVPATPRGNFLAYRSPQAAAHQAKLAQAGIITDVRGNILRFGFGLYHDAQDGAAMADRVANTIASHGI
jgi:selenocysteine lyase/cysteine desulfurase